MSMNSFKQRARKAYRESKASIKAACLFFSPSSRHINPQKVVFICNFGNGYGCNPKYIANELLARESNLDLVWLVNEHDNSMPPQIRQVQFNSYSGLKELSTARIWVDNCRTRRHVKKKPEQFYIQTWHASIWPKKTERDAEDKMTPFYIAGAKQDGRETDLMFANNELAERLYRESFWYEGEVMRCGVPRNVPLLRPQEDYKKKVYKALGLDPSKKLCLYAPTFRHDASTDVYKFDYEKCCDMLNNRFGTDFQFVIRLHPNIADLGDFITDQNICNASYYPDAQELISATDVIISDYSSIADDFALTKRPGYLFAPDMNEYLEDRGFYYPMEYRPYPTAETEEQLWDCILSTTDEQFEQKRKAFFDRVGMDEDGKGDVVIADIIEKVISGEAVHS